MKEVISKSPFRPKLKGQSAMRSHYPDGDEQYLFGRKESWKEDYGKEFIKLFNELEMLALTFKNKHKIIDQDTETFSIAPTIVLMSITRQRQSRQFMGLQFHSQKKIKKRKSSVPVFWRIR